MKAITLHQPWASLVAEGFKGYETRAWVPRVAGVEYRGPLVVHAAASVPAYAREFARQCEEAQEVLGLYYGEWWKDPAIHLPCGRALAVAYLNSVEEAGVVRDRLEQIGDHVELAFGDFGAGRYAWRLADPLGFAGEGVEWRGRQKLWDFPDELIPEGILKASQVPA